MSRITGIDSESQNEDLRKSIVFEEDQPKVINTGFKWYIVLPVVLLLALVTGGGVYYLLQMKKEAEGKSRLDQYATVSETDQYRKLEPDAIPQDIDLRKAIQRYKNGYTSIARAAFTEIVESSKPAEVKAFALIYLGIIADNEGKFNLAVDYFQRALRFDPKNFYAHYNLALALRHKGLYREALEQLEKARAIRPDLIEARNLKGQLQFQSNDFDAAEETFKEAAEEGSDVLALYNLGIVYKKQGKLAEAKAAFLKARQNAGETEIGALSSHQLGLIHATQGDYANAAIYMQQAAKIQPNGKYFYNLAMVQYRLKQTEQALNSLEKAVNAGHENPRTYQYIARLYAEMGQNTRAIAAINQALQQAPMDTELLSQLADLQINQAQWTQAQKTLHQLLEVSTRTAEKADALYNLGRIYIELRLYDKAEEALRKSYNLNPGREEALIALGQTFISQGQGHKAISLYREALKLNPDNLALLKALGGLYLDLGLLTESEITLKKLIEHPLKKEDDVLFAYEALGDIYAKRKSYDTAIKYYQRLVNSGDADYAFSAHMKIARAALDAEKPSAVALEHLEKAISMKPDNQESRLLLAKVLLYEGSMVSRERAEEELTALVTTSSEPLLLSKAHTMRGIIFYKRGHYVKALDDFNRALELDPSNTSAFQNKKAAAARLEESGGI